MRTIKVRDNTLKTLRHSIEIQKKRVRVKRDKAMRISNSIERQKNRMQKKRDTARLINDNNKRKILMNELKEDNARLISDSNKRKTLVNELKEDIKVLNLNIDMFNIIAENYKADPFTDWDNKMMANILETPIEQVKFLQAKGYSNYEIADMLGIGRRWIQRLLKKYREKLDG